MNRLNPTDLANHPEIMGLCAIFGVIMFTVPPLLEYRSWRRGLSRFDRWLANGPGNAESASSSHCPLCGSPRLVTNTVASFATNLKVRLVKCAASGKTRYLETRCGTCGTTVQRRKESA